MTIGTGSETDDAGCNDEARVTGSGEAPVTTPEQRGQSVSVTGSGVPAAKVAAIDHRWHIVDRAHGHVYMTQPHRTNRVSLAAVTNAGSGVS